MATRELDNWCHSAKRIRRLLIACHKPRDATTSSVALIAGTLGTAAAITATGGTGLLMAGCIVSLFGSSIDAGAKIDDLQECTKP